MIEGQDTVGRDETLLGFFFSSGSHVQWPNHCQFPHPGSFFNHHTQACLHWKWQARLQIGGGTKYECWNPKWISMSFQYIRSGKKEFLNLVTVLTLHIDPQYLKNHYIRVKSQSCRRPMVWPIKTCARKALSQPKKNRLNRTYQLREKSKKLPENTIF